MPSLARKAKQQANRKKMKTLNIFTLILLIHTMHISFSCAQKQYDNYYRTLIEAETLEAQKDYNTAYAKYLNAINQTYPFPDDVINAIRCCLKSDHKEDAYDLVKKLILCGYKTETPLTFVAEVLNILEPSTIFPFPELKDYFDSIYDNTRKVYLKNININSNELLNAFNWFELFSITLRVNIDLYAPNMSVDDLQDLCWFTSWSFWEEISKTNVDIRRSVTDSWYDHDLINGLIHISQTVVNTESEDVFYNFLWKMVLEGNIHPMQFAAIKDAGKGRKIGKSILGLFFTYDEAARKIKIAELDDPLNIDSIRKEHFMSPIWVQVELRNQILPSNYIQKK